MHHFTSLDNHSFIYKQQLISLFVNQLIYQCVESRHSFINGYLISLCGPLFTHQLLFPLPVIYSSAVFLPITCLFHTKWHLPSFGIYPSAGMYTHQPVFTHHFVFTCQLVYIHYLIFTCQPVYTRQLVYTH